MNKPTRAQHRLWGLKIALVYPPYGPVRNEPGIKTVKENYGIFPSLSLLYVGGILEDAGCEVLFIDAHAEDLTLDETVARLQKFGPDYIGYTLTTYLFFHSMDWIKAIKALVPVPTIVGGVHLSIYARETLGYDAIDYAVTHEAEFALPQLLKGLQKRQDLSLIKGVAFKQSDGQIVVTPKPRDVDVDVAPFPARSLIDNSIYYSFISQYKNFAASLPVRLPYKCIFCDRDQNSRLGHPRTLWMNWRSATKFGIRERIFRLIFHDSQRPSHCHL